MCVKSHFAKCANLNEWIHVNVAGWSLKCLTPSSAPKALDSCLPCGVSSGALRFLFGQHLSIHEVYSRFFGLFGVYYSLQYLSLSDATVLTFLAPMFTCVTGAVILKEDFHWKQAVAGCEFPISWQSAYTHVFTFKCSWSNILFGSIVCSLLGVVLIARPDFLFGHKIQDTVVHPVEGVEIDIEIDMQTLNPVDSVTPHQRLLAVGWVFAYYCLRVGKCSLWLQGGADWCMWCNWCM